MQSIDRGASFGALPDVAAGCVVSVAIPASDEVDFIATTLAAFEDQREIGGAPLARGHFELVVFANRCRDGTAERARAYARQRPDLTVHVLDDATTDWTPHVGHARGTVMDVAAARMRAGGRDGIVATTDADTIVSPSWISRTIAQLGEVDAVGGHIVATAGATPVEIAALELERRYKRAIVRLETLLDPDPTDPWPRHGNHQGASLAVRASAYARSGGVPRLAILEDFELYKALLRSGSTFRHPLDVRVTTSTRRTGRVEGGFATDLDRLDAHVRGETSFLVTDPAEMARLYRARGLVRRVFAGIDGDPGNAARALAIAPAYLLDVLAHSATASQSWERLGLMTPARNEARRLIPIDRAIAELEARSALLTQGS